MTKRKVEFAPGCFDNFEGTQEELDALVEEIQRLAESGELEANSHILDDDAWEELDEEEQEIIAQALENLDSDPRHLH